VARGIWLYDGRVPRVMEIHALPAKFAASRYTFDENGTEVLDDTRPILDTPDGFVYYVGATAGGEFHTLSDAKKWPDAQPWGPVKWD
jgi:hypothetical protein